MSISKFHHVVPQFYLRNWAIKETLNLEDSEIFILDKEKITIRKQKIKNIGGQNNLYRVKMWDDKIFGKDFFEKALGEIENYFAKDLRKMMDYINAKVSEVDKETCWGISEFIGSQMMRHFAPQTLMRVKIGEKAFDEIIADASDNIKKETLNISEKEIRESVLAMFKVGDILTGALGSLYNPHDDPSRDIFLDYRWVIAKASSNSNFITSDIPIYVYRSLLKRYELRNFSIPYELYFPISPSYMIYMFRKEVVFAPTFKEYEIKEFTKEEVDSINLLKAIYSEREIYSNDTDILEKLKTEFNKRKSKSFRVD